MNFTTMLNDVYDLLGKTSAETVILPTPEIIKGTTRIIWTNVKSFLKRTKTPPDHFIEFLIKQTSMKINWKSESISDGLIIHNNRIQITEISRLMKKYFHEYAICNECKKEHENMFKDVVIRKWCVKCSKCNAEYTLIH